jgi:HEPN domain-containing protein
MTKRKALGLSLLVLLICSTLPTILYANGQVNITVEENTVKLATQAANQIQTLITSIYTDENATEKIQNASLTQQFEGNVTLYRNEGLNQLKAAQEALEASNYDLAADYALQALTIFRDVYRSLNAILENAGLQDNSARANQELMDAINRELQRLNVLQNLLSENTPKEIIALLESANSSLLEAKQELQDGKYNDAQTLYLEAKQNITEIYQYLKTQAEESNTWRLSGYCDGLQQRIQERFRYGSQNGIDFTTTLQSLGYQSETQFLQSLQNRIQDAQSQSDIHNAIQECITIAQMVQQMEQAVNQEISHQQGPNPTNGNSEAGGAGSGVGGATGGNNSNSDNSTGYSGNSSSGKGTGK